MKPAIEIFEADQRNRNSIWRDNVTGQCRPAVAADFRALVADIELGIAVPAIIRQQFDLARNTFVYSWFVYELATLAEKQAYATLEMALREKMRLETGRTVGSRDLRWLMQEAERRKWLMRSDFGDERSPLHLFDFIIRNRNDLAHGSDRLVPDASHEMLSDCAEVIDQLFPSETVSP